MIDDDAGWEVSQLKNFSSGINFRGHPIPEHCYRKIEKQLSNIAHLNKMADMAKVAKVLNNSQKATNLTKHEKELDVKKKGKK